MSKTVIKDFRDLIIYQNLYKAMKMVMVDVLPKLPKEEKYNLVDQLNRACQAAPALIAEGFAKRYHMREWNKYLSASTGESNEMIHHLSVCIDMYAKYVNISVCQEIIKIYEISCKQITKLGKGWKIYHLIKTK